MIRSASEPFAWIFNKTSTFAPNATLPKQSLSLGRISKTVDPRALVTPETHLVEFAGAVGSGLV